MVGARVDVQDDLGAGVPLDGRRAEGVPDVLADVHAHVDAVHHVHGAHGAGLEVAVLVEDAVVRQVHLVVDAQKLAVVGHRGCVVDVALEVDETHHDRYAAGAGNDALHGVHVGAYERRLEEQVLRRIAGDRHLREGHEVCLLRPGALHVLQHLGGVPLQVSDRGVDLGHCQAQLAHHFVLTRSRFGNEYSTRGTCKMGRDCDPPTHCVQSRSMLGLAAPDGATSITTRAPR